MDILQFLASGYNLKSLFKAFGVSEQKRFFPYNYYSHADQLDETTLHPMKLFIQPSRMVTSQKKNMLHSKSSSIPFGLPPQPETGSDIILNPLPGKRK